MLRVLRRRLNYANVIATLALLFAMSGGAYAASHYLIKSTKQLSPSVLKALKGAKGANGVNGAAGPAGPQGPAGPAGAQGGTGKDGAEGKEGKEAKAGKDGGEGKEGKEGKTGFTDTLPVGKTETGAWAAGQASAVVEHEQVAISFPIPLSAEVQANLMPEGATPTTECPSEVVNEVLEPKATAGNLCVYETFGEKMEFRRFFQPENFSEVTAGKAGVVMWFHPEVEGIA